MTSDDFIIRRATVSDAEVIACHRARMFQDMGEAPAEIFEALRARSERWLAQGLQTGEYVGWLAYTNRSPANVIAGGGAQVRRSPPNPRATNHQGFVLAEGRQAIVINVFTEPEWRRHGVATQLLHNILEWSQAEKLDRLVLHASPKGRALYERLGFARTNEMRFSGDLQ